MGPATKVVPSLCNVIIILTRWVIKKRIPGFTDNMQLNEFWLAQSCRDDGIREFLNPINGPASNVLRRQRNAIRMISRWVSQKIISVFALKGFPIDFLLHHNCCLFLSAEFTSSQSSIGSASKVLPRKRNAIRMISRWVSEKRIGWFAVKGCLIYSLSCIVIAASCRRNSRSYRLEHGVGIKGSTKVVEHH
jgi:hypothetical protein